MVKPVEFVDPHGKPLKTLRLLPKTFTPIGSQVAFQWVERDQEVQIKTDGGLFLPDESQDAKVSPLGLVFAVGPDVTHVKRGDVIVLFGGKTYRQVFRNGVFYGFTMQGDIAAVLDEPFKGKCVHGNDPDGCQEHGGACRVTPTPEDEAKLKAGRSRVGPSPLTY